MNQDSGLDTDRRRKAWKYFAEVFFLDSTCLHCCVLGDKRGCSFVWEAVCLRSIVLACLVVSFQTFLINPTFSIALYLPSGPTGADCGLLRNTGNEKTHLS